MKCPNFSGCFLTGTAAEVTPVSQIDKYKFNVCNVIKDLSESYQALVQKKTTANFFHLLKQHVQCSYEHNHKPVYKLKMQIAIEELFPQSGHYNLRNL